MPLEMESGYFSPIPRIEKYAGNPMKRVLHFQGKVIGITGISGQKVIRIALVYPTGLKFKDFDKASKFIGKYLQTAQLYQRITGHMTLPKHFDRRQGLVHEQFCMDISRGRNAIDAMTDFMQYSCREEMTRAMSCGSDYDDYDYEG